VAIDARKRITLARGSSAPVARLIQLADTAIARLGPEEFLLRSEDIGGVGDVPKAPPWLWARGARRILETPVEHRVCVVGSRKCDDAGLRMARQLVSALCDAGRAVVSGGAFGIDAAAHTATLDFGGTTVAVLPGGLDRPYPRSHWRLFDAIVSNGGTLLTPFPPGHRVRRWHFARRNELMAAMTSTTIVVRAAPASGSLLTARAAFALGRRVLAVPADAARPEFSGTNILLAEGAEVLVDPACPALGVAQRVSRQPLPTTAPNVPPAAPPIDLTQRQEAILGALRGGPRHTDELSALLRVPTHELCGDFLSLEFADLVVRARGSVYALTTRGVRV
jgi:DNA processing protein